MPESSLDSNFKTPTVNSNPNGSSPQLVNCWLSVIINLNQAGRWEHSHIELQKTKLQCHIWKIKVVKFIQSPWWIFFVGDPCLIDRADTNDMARFREWLSTCSLIIPTSLSSPESTSGIKEWGRYDEQTQCWAGYSWKTCTKMGNLNVNSTSICSV